MSESSPESFRGWFRVRVPADPAFLRLGPLHKTPQPTWARVLVCSIACLPDERHITGPRSGTAIVDKDRVCAGHLDVHLVLQVDEHDVDPYIAIESTGDGRTARARGRRFQADPLEEGAGNT